MNRLSECMIFNMLDKVFACRAVIQDLPHMIGKYAVDRDKYDYLVQICKTYKYPFASEMTKELDAGLIRPFMFIEPKSVDTKLIKFPTSINIFPIKDSKTGKLVSYVNLIRDSQRYIRNKATDEIESFKYTETNFYANMERGFVSRKLHMYESAFNTDSYFTRIVATSYSRMLARIISMIYGVSAKDEWMQILLYDIGVYVFQCFFNYDLIKAKEMALTMKGINKSTIIDKSKLYNINRPEFDMRFSEVRKNYANSKELLYPFNILLDIIQLEFQYIKSDSEDTNNKKNLSRVIVNSYTSMYGQNSMMAIEHCESFVNMLLSARFTTGMYNELTIRQNNKAEIDDLSKIILSKK